MSNKYNNIILGFVLIVIIIVVVGVAGLGFSAIDDGDDPADENSTSVEQSSDRSVENINNSDDSFGNNASDDTEDNSEEPGNNSTEHASLTVNVESANGGTIQRGQFRLYSSNTTQEREIIAIHNLSKGTTHTFDNLAVGERYSVLVAPKIFPAENFTVQAGQTEDITVEIGYDLRGASAYVREYKVRELGISEDGSIYSDVLFVGQATLDLDGNFHNTYTPESQKGDPSVDWFDLLYIAERNTSYRNLQPTDSEWFVLDATVGPKNRADEIVMNGISEYNRTFIGEVTREGELYHRYETDFATVDVDPETGYVVYADINVEEFEEIELDRSWFSNHDSEDLEAIPEDFEPPSSDDNQTAGG